MKRMVLFIVFVCAIMLSTGMICSGSISKQNNDTLHRGQFNAEIGLHNTTRPIIELDGNYRDFRGRHVLSGSISPVNSDRTNRFQGFISRNLFLIQTGYRNHIVNIVGRFTRFDEDTNEFRGLWRGFMIGHGWTQGWITVALDT